jgi:hypothetical protein
MARESYRACSPGTMGSLTVPNRLVRSATWDEFALFHSVTEDHLDVYNELATGWPVIRQRSSPAMSFALWRGRWPFCTAPYAARIKVRRARGWIAA